MTKDLHTTAIERPPVICIMGHIDHGKSTLLDYIRKSNIVEGEAGGITQHISAYEVEHTTSTGDKKNITFIDTPGHAAFAGIRECGTAAADIAILVVSAEDGVKTQTIEAYQCIESAGVPYVVAINKIDKPAANIERTKISLAESGIYLEGYGGSISYVPVSAKTGEGIPDLLDMLVLTAEVSEFTGNPDILARGTIIETERDPKKGISATLIIKDGTLKAGQFVACGHAWSPTRIFENFKGEKITEATFSSPVRLIGWNEAPPTSEPWQTFETKKELESYLNELQAVPAKFSGPAEDFGEKKVIPVVIKADTVGSVEAIQHELKKIEHERIALKVVFSGLGDITESDVKYVSGTKDALIAAFNVKLDAQAQALVDRLELDNATFSIIYKLTEWIESKLVEKTPTIEVEEVLGKAKILKFFSSTRDKQIIGGKVIDKEIKVGHQVKIVRREVIIGQGLIRELQQTKVKTDSVQEGFEFGALIESKMELAPGDIIEDFVTVEK